MTGRHRRWLCVVTAATMLATTLQAQERSSSAPAERAHFFRESIKRETANVAKTLPRPMTQTTKKGLSRGDKVAITTGIGIAAGLLIGSAIHEKGYDLAPLLGLGAMIGGGIGTAVGFSW